MSDWMIVVLAIVGGIVVGAVASRVVHGLIGSPNRPEPIQQAAKPLASLAFAIGIVGGLVVALGVVQPSALDQLRDDAVSFIPKLMTAAIIIIAANVLSSFATTALAQTMGRMPSHIQRQTMTIVKGSIVSLAVLLAVSQLGINTDVVNLGVAAVFFGIAASLTLLVGLGGHSVAREVASTRAMKRLLNQGDTVRMNGIQGVVRAVHPTTIEVAADDGEIVLVPSSRLLSETITIDRVEQADSPTV